ncbi:Hypothetical predicted protein [Mytilus galloprovincialis]|uniref:Endonuclease n=1 Tax=Mytilus galloprovincialis TaxID=29158 RepID=A0A8B6CXV9_MYTGA|nr:Hypothetical predicted protein [Mytilus galloprovincialis]
MNIRNLFVICLYFGTSETEVVKSYNECWPHRFFYQGFPPTLLTYSKDIVIICQQFKNEPRYVTLYDTKNRIPLFSATQPTQADVLKTKSDKNGKPETRDQFFIEPNLADKGGKNMIEYQPENLNLNNPHDAKYGQKQALDVDYRVRDKHVYDRGHLNPQLFNNKDDNSKIATNALTNIAPQYKEFNQNTWKKLEEGIKKNLRENCIEVFPGARMFVVVGVEPSSNKFIPEKPKRARFPGSKKKQKIKTQSENTYGRINVPKSYWTAVCCDTSALPNIDNRRKGWSFAYEADNFEDKTKIKVVFHPVEKFLQHRYSSIFADYTNNGNNVQACQFNKENAVTIIQDMAKKISGHIFDTNTLLKNFYPNKV